MLTCRWWLTWVIICEVRCCWRETGHGSMTPSSLGQAESASRVLRTHSPSLWNRFVCKLPLSLCLFICSGICSQEQPWYWNNLLISQSTDINLGNCLMGVEFWFYYVETVSLCNCDVSHWFRTDVSKLNWFNIATARSERRYASLHCSPDWTICQQAKVATCQSHRSRALKHILLYHYITQNFK